jgi:site-specific DNA-cytosine methylase
MTLYAAEPFAGAGFLRLAFTVEGIEVGEACEFNKYAVDTMNANFGMQTQPCDATKWTPQIPPGGIDILFGGPPCQPWSGGGSQQGQHDPRDMFPQIIRWAHEAKPKLIVMENTGATVETRQRAHSAIKRSIKTGILDQKFKDYFTWWWSEMDAAGYDGVVWSLLACDYGTPQVRARVFFVLWPHGSPLQQPLSFQPPITHVHPDDAERLGLAPWASGFERLADGCIGGFGYYSCANLNNIGNACETCYSGSNYAQAEDDFTDVELTEQNLAYIMKDPQRIHKHPPVDMSGRYQKAFDRWVAPNLVADLYRGVPYGMVIEPGGLIASDFAEPQDYQFLRRLTPRECAKLMDVPQWFWFKGKKGIPAQKYKQIGNGVSINMGRAVARHILAAFGEPLLPTFESGEGFWSLNKEDLSQYAALRSQLRSSRL